MNAPLKSKHQRGSADVWITIAIVCVLVFIAVVVVQSNNKFKEDCKKAGGVPVIGRYDNVCYEPGTVKFSR